MLGSSWVTMTKVTPRASRRCKIRASSSADVTGSRPAEGSSSPTCSGERTAAAVHEDLQRAGVSFSAKEFSRLLARLASTGIIALDGRRAASIAAAHSLLREEVR